LDQTVSGFFNIDNVGFYADNGWASFAYIDDVKCYVASEADAIDDVRNGTIDANETTYDLLGRRVEHPVQGVYIRNGKKFIMK
jgi:hypothetical protein